MIYHMEEPNPKQVDFFKAKNRFVAYGGARGGGKSWAVRRKAALLALNYPGIRILIIRRTYTELTDNHILPMSAELMGIAEYKDSQKTMVFPNGSRVNYGYCENEKDALRYQGQEYDVLFIDEATQLREGVFQKLSASVRGVNNFPKRVYLTCNPGGIGHEWVKRLFIDRKYNQGEDPEDYLFISATLKDNKALMEADPEYIKMLNRLPENLRRAWLDGDWNILEGRYFKEFDPVHHVVEPFSIPNEWPRYFAMDYGLDRLAAYWIAMDYSGRAYVYKEKCESDLIISKAAEAIKAMTIEEITAYIAPPDLWNRRQDSGKSAADIFAEHGVPLTKASNNRVQGWYDLKEWLNIRVDEFGEEKPGLVIFSNCTELIECIPMLTHSERDPNDVATEPHEITHAPDALRYFVAGRPSPAMLPVERDDDVVDIDTQVSSFLDFGR